MELLVCQVRSMPLRFLIAPVERSADTTEQRMAPSHLSTRLPFLTCYLRVTYPCSCSKVLGPPLIPNPTDHGNKFSQVSGPLGIESASLKDKVALVTGAGMLYTRLTCIRN